MEHSRILCFGEPASSGATFLIGSADLMPRNLYNRVEAMVSVVDSASRARLAEILETCLADDVQAWVLESDGSWVRLGGARAGGVGGVGGVGTHRRLQELASARQPTIAMRPAPVDDLDEDDDE